MFVYEIALEIQHLYIFIGVNVWHEQLLFDV